MYSVPTMLAPCGTGRLSGRLLGIAPASSCAAPGLPGGPKRRRARAPSSCAAAGAALEPTPMNSGTASSTSPACITRIRSTYWDPANEHVLVPHAIGVGWTVNLGAVAKKLGLLD